jgi:hypothetical protein
MFLWTGGNSLFHIWRSIRYALYERRVRMVNDGGGFAAERTIGKAGFVFQDADDE